MNCPRCGNPEYLAGGTCSSCDFSGELALLELRAHLLFLLGEIEGWQTDLPESNRIKLLVRYQARLRAVDVRLGLREPPLGPEEAAEARFEQARLTWLVDAIQSWHKRGLLDFNQASLLIEETRLQIEGLRESLLDAPVTRPISSLHLGLGQWRLARDTLLRLHTEGRLVPSALPKLYETTLNGLERAIENRELELGLRQPPLEPALATAAAAPGVARGGLPARSPRPARPPRQPLTWERVMASLLSERTLQAILFMGCLLLFAAAVSLVVWNWETFSPWLQLTFLALFTATFYAMGWFVRVRMNLRGSGLALTGVGSLLAPLDVYAIYISGGLPAGWWEEVWVLASALCLGLYLLTLYRLQAYFFGYLVGLAVASLAAALLNLGGLNEVWWPAGILTGILAMLIYTERLPEAREGEARTWKILNQPMWWVAALASASIMAISLGREFISPGASPAAAPALALNWWLGTAAFSLAAWRFRRGMWVLLAAGSLPIAVLLSQRALLTSVEAGPAWYAFGMSLVPPLYFWLGRRAQAGEAYRSFSRIFTILGGVLAVAAAAWSLGETAAAAAVHPLLAASLFWAAWLWQRPWLSVLGSLLLLSGSAAWLGWRGAALDQLGLGWTLLALLHIIAALRMRERRGGENYFSAPLFLGGWVAAALAILPPLVAQERGTILYVLGNWILLNGWLALIGHTREAPGLLAVFRAEAAQEKKRFRPQPRLTWLHWSAALAILPWLWLAWVGDFSIPSETGPLALVFGAAALALLFWGATLRRAAAAYGLAWIVTAHLANLLGLGLALAAPSEAYYGLAYLLGSLVFFASAFLLRGRSWFWLGGLCFAFFTVVFLNNAGLPGALLGMGPAGAALLFVLSANILEKRVAFPYRFIRPLYQLAWPVGGLVLLLGLLYLAQSGTTDLDLVQVASSLILQGLAFGLLAWLDRRSRLAGHAAAWLGVMGGGFIAVAYSQGRGSSAFKAGLLAAAYILAERSLLQGALGRLPYLSGISGSRAFFRRAWRLYARPLLAAGWAVTGGAILLALLLNLVIRGGGREREAWTVAALLLIVGLYAAGAHWYRRSGRASRLLAWLAFGLLPLPWTLLYRQGGFVLPDWTVPPLPSLAVGWIGLALVGLSFGLWVKRRWPGETKWSLPARWMAHLLAPLALLWSSAHSPSAVLVFGLGSLFYLSAALDAWRSRRDVFFFYPAALLPPLWVLYLLAYYVPQATQVHYAVLLFAISGPYLGLGWQLWRGAGTRLGLPFLLAAYGSLGTALVLAGVERPALAGGLVYAAAAGVLSAVLFHQPLWLYPAGIALPWALLLTLAEQNVLREQQGWWLIGLAGVYLMAAYQLHDRNKLKAYAIPLIQGGFALTAIGLGISSINSRAALPAYTVAALIYALCAAWLRQPLLLWGAAGLGWIAYYAGMLELNIGIQDYGLAAWLFIITALLIAYTLDRGIPHKSLGMPGASPLGRWLHAAWQKVLHWWALPFYTAGYLGAALAMLGRFNDPESLPLTALLAALAYGLATWRFRRPAWLFLAAGTAQLAAFRMIVWSMRGEEILRLGPVMLAFTFVTALTLLAAIYFLKVHDRPVQGEDRPLIFLRWSDPLYILFVLDLFITQIGTLLPSAESAWVSLINAGLLAVFVTAWRHRNLTYLAALLGLIALAQGLLWAEAGELAWPWALGLLALVYGTLGYAMLQVSRNSLPDEEPFSNRLAHLWGQPLRASAWWVSGLSLIMLLFQVLNVAPLILRALLDLPVLGTAELARVQSLTATLALAGLFYLVAGVIGRQRWLAYGAVGILLAAWSLEWLLVWGMREIQWYAVPAGCYLLAIGYLEWEHGSQEAKLLASWIDRAAILLLLGSAFWQSLSAVDGWPYALLMGAEALLLVWWGSGRRLKRFLYAGVAGFTVNVVAQSIEPLLSNTDRWIVLLIAGLVLVIAGALVERRLEQVKKVSSDFRKRMEDWQ